MESHHDSPQGQKDKIESTQLTDNKSSEIPAAQLVSNRPEAIAQRTVQEMANNSSQVRQLNAYQQMANNSARVKNTMKLIAAENSNEASEIVQKKGNGGDFSQAPIQRVVTAGKPATTGLSPKALAVRADEAPNDLGGNRYWAEIIFSGGLMYKKTGEVDGRRAQAKIVDGKVIYVFGTNGEVYIRSEPQGVPRPDGFTHANFLSGVAVKTAGQMFVRGGQITRLDNESGHYMPHSTTLEWMLQKLVSHGVNLVPILLVMIEKGGDRIYSAHDYFNTPNIGNVQPVDNQVRVEDEDYQKQYDAHLGENTIKFDYFRWPYSRFGNNESNPKIRLIREKAMAGNTITVEIVCSSEDKIFRGEQKNRTTAMAAIRNMLQNNNLRMLGSVHSSSLAGKKLLLQMKVASNARSLITPLDRRGHP